MMNAVGRELPVSIKGYGPVKPFEGCQGSPQPVTKVPVTITPWRAGTTKRAVSIQAALEACGLRDGMTLSFHHHLRNGDHVLNMVMKAVAEKGVKDIHVAATSIFRLLYR